MQPMDEQALQQTAGGIGIVVVVFYVAFIALMIASGWKIFTKAGKPGWAVLVPIYNIVVYLQICQKPVWWIVLLLIPIVNFIIAIMLCVALAKVFGKGAGYAIGLLLLGIVFFPMLAFGSAQYVGGNAPAPAA